MVYDFVARIKNVQDKEVVNEEYLDQIVSEINVKFEAPLELKFVLPDQDHSGEFLVKSQASVSSLPGHHDKDLDIAINAFKSYLEEISKAIQGEISQQDGFYNNSKSFRRLYE